MTEPKNHETHGTLDQARESANHAIESARDAAGKAAPQTAAAVESNPLGRLVGGLALGALVAAVIPRSQREKDLLAPTGRKLAAAATAALAAAKDAGRAELSDAGLSRSAAQDRAHSLLDGVMKAVSSAGTAAVSAGKDAARA
jgi:hypothetical protein